MRLALPAAFGRIIMVIYNMADTFFVSLTRSDATITAVTVCILSLFGVADILWATPIADIVCCGVPIVTMICCLRTMPTCPFPKMSPWSGKS